MKNPVRKTIIVKIENKPAVNERISALVFDFKLKPINIGNIGSMHGDNIEMTPVKKEIKGNTSIYIPLIVLKNSPASTYPSILFISF